MAIQSAFVEKQNGFFNRLTQSNNVLEKLVTNVVFDRLVNREKRLIQYGDPTVARTFIDKHFQNEIMNNVSKWKKDAEEGKITTNQFAGLIKATKHIIDRDPVGWLTKKILENPDMIKELDEQDIASLSLAIGTERTQSILGTIKAVEQLKTEKKRQEEIDLRKQLLVAGEKREEKKFDLLLNKQKLKDISTFINILNDVDDVSALTPEFLNRFKNIVADPKKVSKKEKSLAKKFIEEKGTPSIEPPQDRSALKNWTNHWILYISSLGDQQSRVAALSLFQNALSDVNDMIGGTLDKRVSEAIKKLSTVDLNNDSEVFKIIATIPDRQAAEKLLKAIIDIRKTKNSTVAKELRAKTLELQTQKQKKKETETIVRSLQDVHDNLILDKDIQDAIQQLGNPNTEDKIISWHSEIARLQDEGKTEAANKLEQYLNTYVGLVSNKNLLNEINDLEETDVKKLFSKKGIYSVNSEIIARDEPKYGVDMKDSIVIAPGTLLTTTGRVKGDFVEVVLPNDPNNTVWINPIDNNGRAKLVPDQIAQSADVTTAVKNVFDTAKKFQKNQAEIDSIERQIAALRGKVDKEGVADQILTLEKRLTKLRLDNATYDNMFSNFLEDVYKNAFPKKYQELQNIIENTLEQERNKSISGALDRTFTRLFDMLNRGELNDFIVNDRPFFTSIGRTKNIVHLQLDDNLIRFIISEKLREKIKDIEMTSSALPDAMKERIELVIADLKEKGYSDREIFDKITSVDVSNMALRNFVLQALGGRLSLTR